MAFVYKGDAGVAPVYHSALARAGTDMVAFGRQRDAYRLAKMGNRDMKRLWNDFAAEVPAMARLVVADVEGERRESVLVAEKVDKRLREAEKLTGKGGKAKVVKVKVAKSRRDALLAADRALRLAAQESSNPLMREWSRMAGRG